MTLNPDNIFDLSEFSIQEELLSVDPVARDIDSSVESPVAHVVLDVPVLHMDKIFDYEIPEKFRDVAIGSRVQVDLGPRRVEGFVVARSAQTRFAATLRPLKKVVSPVPVLTESIYALAQLVASRQSATVGDALRLAIPQRHARAEREFIQQRLDRGLSEFPKHASSDADAPANTANLGFDDDDTFLRYRGGAAFLARVGRGEAIRAQVSMAAVDTVEELVIPVLRRVLAQQKTAILIVPTPRQAQDLASSLSVALNTDVSIVQSHDSHEVRYREFLRALYGESRVIVGTRSAAWLPSPDLGALILVDDQHSAMREPHSPYLHTRDLLRMRAEVEQVSFLSLNYGPSVEMCAVENWAPALTIDQGQLRSLTPQIMSAISFAYEDSPFSRMPRSVFAVARAGLERGHVLFVVPQTGYYPAVACARCRELLRCPKCASVMAIPQPDAPLTCTMCRHVVKDFVCTECRHTKIRAIRVGSHRTAQEIGRAFRGVSIHTANHEHISLDEKNGHIVVAPISSLPWYKDKFAAAIVLDAGSILRSSGLNAESYFLRTLAHVAAHVASRAEDGQLLVVGDVPAQLMHPLITWDFVHWSREQLNEREMLKLPPAFPWIAVRGTLNSLREYLTILRGLALDAGLESSNASIDALLGGGVADLIPGLSILGPHSIGNDMMELYLRCGKEDRDLIRSIVDRAHRIASVQRVSPLRVVVDPAIIP